MVLKRSIVLAYDQIMVLVYKDFKLKYNSTAIGFLWSLLVPVCMSLMYYFIFGVILRWQQNNYLLYLFSGSFFWQYFSSVVMGNGRVLMSNSGLLKKTALRRELLLWVTYVAEGIHFLLTCVVLFGVMLGYHIRPQLFTGALNSLVLLVFFPMFTMGISYLYAALNVYFRDLERIMEILLRMWCFLSPIFISMDSIPEKYLWFYRLNPMAGFIGIFRDIFYQPGLHPEAWLVPCVTSVVLLCLGRWIFNRMSPRFAEMV